MSKFFRYFFILLAILIGIFVCFLIREVIGFLLLAFVFASALRPGVDLLERKKIPRVVSALVIFLLFSAFFITILFLTLPPLMAEIQNFFLNFPKFWERFLNNFPQIAGTPLEKIFEEALKRFSQSISSMIPSLMEFLYNTFARIFNLFFIVIATFYLIVEKEIGEKLIDFFFGKNEALEKKTLRYWKLAENFSGRWLQGYIFLSLVVGTMVYICLSFLKVKYALLLGVIAGLLEIIPFLGPITAGTIGFFLSLMQGGFSLAIWTALVFFVVQMFENYLIVPLVMKNRVDLNPLLTIIVLFIGGKIGGVLGMILAVPISAILISFWKEIHQKNNI